MKFILAIFLFLPLFVYPETIYYSTEMCADESRRMGQILGGAGKFLSDTAAMEKYNVKSERDRKEYVEFTAKQLEKIFDENYKKWSDAEAKETRPFWKNWNNFKKLIGADVGESGLALWRENPKLSPERYERLLYQKCMGKWAGTFEVTFERPVIPVTPPQSTSTERIIVQPTPNAQPPSQPMGQNMNRCQQDGGSLTCLNRPSGPQMPRQGMTPYQ
jgi:hypothetical protein